MKAPDDGASVERVADHFVNYLFDTYRGSRHVRHVASWVGFLVGDRPRESRWVQSKSAAPTHLRLRRAHLQGALPVRLVFVQQPDTTDDET